jgi:carboxyl-terminal processing protease
MTQRILRTTALVALVATLAGLLLAVRAPAEPVPERQDRVVVRMVAGLLQEVHLNKPEIGSDISKRLFRRFLKELDPNKMYFLKSDVDEFKKSETELGDMLLKGDISFAYQVYERLVKRIGERLPLIEELLKAKHDFTVKEYMSTDGDAAEYATDETELRERWRKRIKFDLLLERVATKPVPEDEAKQKVLSRYRSLLKRWKQEDHYDLMERYLTDLSTSVDPHSSYMSPNTLDDFEISMRLHLEGIGATLRSENGQTIVVDVVAGGAASADGRLKANDKIIGVAQGDDKFVDVQDMKLRDVVQLIRGARGTKVQLKVVQAQKTEPALIDLTRRTIELKSQAARGEIIEQGKKADGTPYRIGVIDVPSFYADMSAPRAGNGGGGGKSATEDVRRILKDFETQKVDGVVLDLRHNGGGALTEARALTGLFIDQGPVVQVKGSQGRVQRQDDPEKGTVYAGPLMVVVSKFSASASEILAGALQDYGRALIVGDSRTHGKGTVQAVLDLGSELRPEQAPKLGALKLTIQQFYRVNGDSTQEHGVSSDVVLPSLTEVLSDGEKELEYALAFDHVNAAKYEDLGLVTSDLKAVLKIRSAERVKKSADFAKLQKEMDEIKARKERKAFPLNEQELKDQFAKDGTDKTDPKENLLSEPMADGKPYKFERNFTNNEVLQIMQDLLQGKKLVSER